MTAASESPHPASTAAHRCPNGDEAHGSEAHGNEAQDAAGPARAVFLDRDGVLIVDTGYRDDPEALALLPGVVEALRLLRERGWRLVVVSNQAGVGRGRFPIERVAAMHARLRQLLAAGGISLDAIFFCPHYPGGSQPPFNVECDHRKPAPGMLVTAAARLGLRLAECWMVGDKESDVAAGAAAGCRTIRIGSRDTAADVSAETILKATHRILSAPDDGLPC